MPMTFANGVCGEGERVEPDRYIPALRLRWLTAAYDPLMERWMTAARMRKAVIAALELRPGMHVLELGSGPGRLAVEIKRRYPGIVLDAVDVDPAMVEHGVRLAKAAGVEVNFHRQNIARLPGWPPFDRIYSTLVFHHLMPDDKQRALEAVRPLLRRGGRFVVADFGRPRGLGQWLLSHTVQPLDGIRNTSWHRSGRFEGALRAGFSRVDSVAAWPTFAGTLEVFVCVP